MIKELIELLEKWNELDLTDEEQYRLEYLLEWAREDLKDY